MNASSIHCPAAVVMSLAEATPRTDSLGNLAYAGAEEIWRAALAEYRRSGPCPASCVGLFSSSRAAGAMPMESAHAPPSQQPATPPTKRLDDFFAVTNELERLNGAMGATAVAHRVKPCESEELHALGLSLDPAVLHEELLLAHCDRKPAADDECCRAADAFRKGRFAEAASLFVDLLARHSSSRSAALLLSDAAATCFLRAELWQESSRLSRRCLELCEGFDVALRRLCRLAVITRNSGEATRLSQTHRQHPQWETENKSAAELERYTALMKARRPAEAARSVENLLALLPCGQLVCWRVQLLLAESRQAAAAYAAAQRGTYATSPELRFWCCETRFQCASSVLELESVREAVVLAIQEHRSSTALRGLDLRVRAALALVSEVEEFVHKGLWDRVAGCCDEALRQQSDGARVPVWADGVLEYMYAHRARAYWEGGRTYQALDDAQRALALAEGDAARTDLLLLVARCEERLRRLHDAVYHAQQAVCAAPAALAAPARQYLCHLKAKLVDAQQEAAAAAATARAKGGSRGKTHADSGGCRYEGDAQRRSEQCGGRGPSTRNSAHSTASPSPHVVLCLPSDVSDVRLVKKSYHKLAVKWHPDKWCGRQPEEIKQAEEQFRLIQSAYETVLHQLQHRGE